MTKQEFIRVAKQFGLELAVCAALTAGVVLAQVELWKMSV